MIILKDFTEYEAAMDFLDDVRQLNGSGVVSTGDDLDRINELKEAVKEFEKTHL